MRHPCGGAEGEGLMDWEDWGFLPGVLFSVFAFFSFLILIFYCYLITVVWLFSPPLHPTTVKPLSLPHFHPPPWFCPCVFYSSSCNPLFPLSPRPPRLLLDCSQLQCLWLYFVCFFHLLIMFQLKGRSYGICPSPPGLFHLA